jgi:hypothetical protein
VLIACGVGGPCEPRAPRGTVGLQRVRPVLVRDGGEHEDPDERLALGGALSQAADRLRPCTQGSPVASASLSCAKAASIKHAKPESIAGRTRVSPFGICHPPPPYSLAVHTAGDCDRSRSHFPGTCTCRSRDCRTGHLRRSARSTGCAPHASPASCFSAFTCSARSGSAGDLVAKWPAKEPVRPPPPPPSRRARPPAASPAASAARLRRHPLAGPARPPPRPPPRPPASAACLRLQREP